jgi:hypothetical protein
MGEPSIDCAHLQPLMSLSIPLLLLGRTDEVIE